MSNLKCDQQINEIKISVPEHAEPIMENPSDGHYTQCVTDATPIKQGDEQMPEGKVVAEMVETPREQPAPPAREAPRAIQKYKRPPSMLPRKENSTMRKEFGAPPAKKEPSTIKKENSTMKKANSSIPVAVNLTKKGPTRHPVKGSYVNQLAGPQNASKPPDKKTLELQFIKNRKLLMEMQDGLLDKQRPIFEKYKSLVRTQKQLEQLGKKVSLDELRFEYKEKDPDDVIDQENASERLKVGIDEVVASFADLYKNFINKQERIVKLLTAEDRNDDDELNPDLDNMKNEANELQVNFDLAIQEQEKKIYSVMNDWQNLMNRKKEEELNTKIEEIEGTLQEQLRESDEAKKTIQELRKSMEDTKINHDIVLEEQEKKFKAEMQKEKKTTYDTVSKMTGFRAKVTDLENKNKDLEFHQVQTMTKLQKAHDELKQKESQWLKEKEDLNKKLELARERRTMLDKRVKMMEDAEKEHSDSVTDYENELRTTKNELEKLEEDNRMLNRKYSELQHQLEEQKGNHEYELTIKHLEEKVKDLTVQMQDMQTNMHEHAKLTVALKLEKDSAVKYSNHIRETLREAKDELDHKTKTIYKLHENLVLRDSACEKLQLKISKEEKQKGEKTRCQICGKRNDWDTLSLDIPKVGKFYKNQLMSESLIGLSVKKVDRIRARLDNIRKVKLEKFNKIGLYNKLQKHIEMKAKLYEILQKHADASCEDFINLLKFTASKHHSSMTNTAPNSSKYYSRLSPNNYKSE